MKRQLVLVALAALAGCASLDPYAEGPVAASLERDDTVGYCARLFADVDRRVDTLGVRDAGVPRVPGFPYLRVDRFTAALAERADSEPKRKAWWTRLAQLDDEARTAELSNAALDVDDLARCRVLLADADAAAFERLRAAATVPDDYSLTMRTLGLYPLARLPFAAGVTRWQGDMKATFAAPLETLPVRGQLVRFAVAAQPGEVKLPAGADPLGVPLLPRFDRAALLIRHAPVLEIDVVGAHDRPGTMGLAAEDRVVVDPAQPVVYTRVAHTLMAGEVHLQLVYTFWFSERPAAGSFDLLAGRLDGLIWRVTLDRDGTPLVYDSIHPCGCYHLFFPTDRVRPRPAPDTFDEVMFSPQAVRVPGPTEVIVLRLESGTHYLQRVSAEPRAAGATGYRLEEEHRLTALPRPGGGTRSAYGQDGLIAGTERAERWFFWPMGIESSGQMRQWGRHATAFVGRRHFDDPLLFDAYFELRR